ncbi:MAG: penicillin-binding protein [Deltaproteobacteria bacterium]|nr:MAG: penicillin-binding protein [Deltaproteobacteria bacterium]
MKIKEKKWIRFRIILVASVFVCGFGAIVARAYQFQVIKRDRLQAMAQSGYTGVVKLPPDRGTIYDRSGHELAVSTNVSSVYAHPRHIKDKRKTSRILARVLGLSKNKIYRKLCSRRSFVWVKRKVDPAKAAEIRKLKLTGVGIEKEKGRYYPGKELAAQLLGFVGIDNNGLEGLEAKYDDILTGPGYELIQMKDALGRPFFIRRECSESRSAHNLVLTIDKDIQYRAERALLAAVKKTRAKGGQCVVLDPATGEILAMAVVPRFNPNIFFRYPRWYWRNKAVTDCFEPGSTIKSFLLAAALEDGVLYPNSRLYCEMGKYKVADRVIHDTHKYGTLTVADIVVLSSNIGAIKIGQQLGYERFYHYLRRFGFGSRTEVDLLGERNGFVRPPGEARPVDQANAYFGQGLSVTALQLATAMACIANKGILMKPFVLKEITDSHGRVLRLFKPRTVRKVISPETAEKVTAILEGVVTDHGTGPRAAIAGYRVAGKTGTAQKVDEKTGRYSRTKYVASFVGFVPAENPRLVIATVIDEPKGIVYGGVVAAPVFSEVGRWALNHLKINPSTRLAEKRQVSPEPAGSEACNPKTVRHTSGIGRRDTVSGSGCLPDFAGMGIREVLCEAVRLGIKVRLEGTGFAYRQTPSPGVPIKKIKYVKIIFRPPRS